MSQSQENPIETITRLYSFIGAGDIAAAAEILDPNADFFVIAGMPHQKPFYKGREEFVQGVWGELKAIHVPDIAPELQEMFGGTDQAVSVGRYKGTSNKGRAVDIPFVHVWTVRGGRVVELRAYSDTEKWRTALA